MKYFPPAPTSRPQWVTIIAIVAAIAGFIGFFGALCSIPTMLGAGAVLGSLGAGAAGLKLGFIGIVYGLLWLVSSILSLGFAYGAWYLKPWAWTLGVASEGLAIFTALVDLLTGGSFFSFLISAAIAGAIIYFLFTPEVKRVFGRI